MDDDVLAQFTSITGASPERAQQYLTLTDQNVEQAIQLYFESDGIDMGGSLPSRAPAPTGAREVINLDSDSEDEFSGRPNHLVEDDEAVARRMQDELYGSAGRGGGAGDGEDDLTGDVRAPQARTTETLLGPGVDWRDDPDEMNAAIAEQMAARARRAMGQFEVAPTTLGHKC